jgi:hypothetical protein
MMTAMAAAPIAPNIEGSKLPTWASGASVLEVRMTGVFSLTRSLRSSVEIWAQTTVAARIQAVVVRIGFMVSFVEAARRYGLALRYNP